MPGTPAPVWQMRDIPHGSVDWNAQHSAVYNDTHDVDRLLEALS